MCNFSNRLQGCRGWWWPLRGEGSCLPAQLWPPGKDTCPLPCGEDSCVGVDWFPAAREGCLFLCVAGLFSASPAITITGSACAARVSHADLQVRVGPFLCRVPTETPRPLGTRWQRAGSCAYSSLCRGGASLTGGSLIPSDGAEPAALSRSYQPHPCLVPTYVQKSLNSIKPLVKDPWERLVSPGNFLEWDPL